MGEKLISDLPLYHFYGAGGIPAAGSPGTGPWVSRTTGAAPPTATVNLGAADLALTATNEAQIIGIDFNDELVFDIDELCRVEWLAKINATPATGVVMIMGLAGAYNATPDTVAQNAWFRFQASAALLAESDDGTTDLDDKSTGLTVGTAWRRYAIDFATGIQTRQPQSASTGGKSNILFYAGDANDYLRQVAKTVVFDMSAYTGGLQLYFQVHKTATTATGTLSVKDIEVTLKQN